MSTKIMLVDDEVPFVETMSKRLAKRGYEVVPAYSGEEALRLLAEKKSIDVVILDVKMPGMHGIAVLREIKKDFPLIEVIMLTGHATVESAIEGMELGAHHYLMKPTDMDVLVRKIEEAMAKKTAHEEKIVKARAESIALRRGD